MALGTCPSLNVVPASSPPGWFPDPYGAVGLQRYWDGRDWTQATQPVDALNTHQALNKAKEIEERRYAPVIDAGERELPDGEPTVLDPRRERF